MKLTDLNPTFVSGSGGVRKGIGIIFDCPCGKCGTLCGVEFRNPIDGGPLYDPARNAHWQRTGETFESLTLTPSIHRSGAGGCGWHGYITNGEVLTV